MGRNRRAGLATDGSPISEGEPSRELLGREDDIGVRYPASGRRARRAWRGPLKPLVRLLAIPVVGCAISAFAMARAAGLTAFGTRAFFFEGRWYAVGQRTTAESVLRNELAKAGYELPRETEDSRDRLDCEIDALSSTAPKIGPRPLHLPSGLGRFHAADSLRTESATHTVDIASGTVEAKIWRIRNALIAAGWHVAQSGQPGEPYCIATMNRGRETSIVVLEEDKGSVLVLRQMEK